MNNKTKEFETVCFRSAVFIWVYSKRLVMRIVGRLSVKIFCCS